MLIGPLCGLKRHMVLPQAARCARESEPPTIQNLQFRADFRAESALNFCRFLRNNIMILGKF